MSSVINTNSWLFNLYATRQIRTDEWKYKTKDDVIRKDAESMDICNYARRIGLQVANRCLINFGKFILGLILGFVIVTDVMTAYLWATTDNGLIVFFGIAGEIVMAIQLLLLAFGVVMLLITLIEEYGGRVRTAITGTSGKVATMSTIATATQWIKAKHGKFCVKLTFDNVPDKPEDEDDNDWPRS